MNCDGISENKCFTITWKIENFNYSWQTNGECISSPVFIVDSKAESKWKLNLFPKGKEKDFISFYLLRENDDREDENFDSVLFQLSFLASDNSVLTSRNITKNSFVKSKSWGYPKFVKRDEVLKIRRKDYLPGNVLTVQCKMWSNNEVINNGHCFARTRIGVERRSFVWNIRQFSSFQESICEIPSTSAVKSIIKLKFFPSNGQNSETFIRVKFCDPDLKLKMLTFRIHLVDSSENRVECLNDEIECDASFDATSFTLTFSKEELMKNKNRYLPSEVLKLDCECTFLTGIVLEEIQNITFGCPPLIQEGRLTTDDLKSKNMLLDSSKALKENLESLYEENLLCDTKLRTKTGSFPAHKVILSARSPVFKKMFITDMKEKSTGCVDIEDLDDDTVERMLLYIYTSMFQDLQLNSACNLYVAADKYEILSLKSECSSFLKDNLSPDNACDILTLAGNHYDKELKSAVQEYILNHKDIFYTNEWKIFMKMNVRLAADLMHLMLKK
ncbi:TD and POZ domain-containing protein 5 [Trichonephila clavipes]|nr:TD and POZ domain-containing protein 5 [Trichonephila clavipes]